MEAFQQQQQYSNQQFEGQQQVYPQNLQYQPPNQEATSKQLLTADDLFQQRYSASGKASGQTTGIQEHYNPGNYMPHQSFHQLPVQGSSGQMNSFQRQHQVPASYQPPFQHHFHTPDLTDISQLTEQQRQNLVHDILKGANLGPGLFSATQLLNSVQQTPVQTQAQNYLNSKQQLPLQTQSLNTPNFSQQQFQNDPAPQSQQLNITQMYQNLNHYQTMLKEIEQLNNKPFSSGVVSNQEPPKPFQPQNSFLNQGNFKEKTFNFEHQPNQSFYQQQSLKESPSKEYLRVYNNNMNESSISGFRQDSSSKFKANFKPERSNSPPREAFQMPSHEQSFHNRSKQSIRESNQENIPNEVIWPSQSNKFEESFNHHDPKNTSYTQQTYMEEPAFQKKSSNFDELPLPTSKPKTFDELLAENLGVSDQPIESEPVFHETSQFGYDQDNKPKKQFLKRKTANVQAPIATKKYNYYAEKYNGERKTETYQEEVETKSVQPPQQLPRPTSREATQVTERQSQRNTQVQKKPFLSKGKGQGGGNKRNIASEKSPNRTPHAEEDNYQNQQFSPKNSTNPAAENNRYGRKNPRNNSGRHMEDDARSSIAEFEKFEQQCNDRYSPAKQQVYESSHHVEQDSPQQTDFRETQVMKQQKKVFDESESDDEVKRRQNTQPPPQQQRKMIQPPHNRTAATSREQKEQIEQAIQRGIQQKQQELDAKLAEAADENEKFKNQKVFMDQQLAKFRLDQREFENRKKREMEELQKLKEDEKERNAAFRKELEKKQKNSQLVAQKDNKLKEDNDRLKKELQRLEEQFLSQEQAYKKQADKQKKENDDLRRQVQELSNEIQHIEELRECELNEVDQLKQTIAQQQLQIQTLEKQIPTQPKSILKQSKEIVKDSPKQRRLSEKKREQDEVEAAPHFGNQNKAQKAQPPKEKSPQRKQAAPSKGVRIEEEKKLIEEIPVKKEKASTRESQKKQAILPRGVRIEEEKQQIDEDEPLADDLSVEKDEEEEEEDYDMKFEDRYHAKNAANQKVLEQIIGNDGKIQRTFESGKKEIIFNNGVKRESWTDGYTIVYFNNNDIKQTYPDKKIVYYFADAQTTQTTFPDGLQVFKFQNGQIEKHYADGTKEISFPDGTIKCIFHDGEEESIFPDGTIQRIEKSGIKAIEFANGQKDILFPDGTRIREYPDGKIRKTLPNGEVETTYRN